MNPRKAEIVLNDKYAPLLNAACPCRYYVITGGRGSGKSFVTSIVPCLDIVKPQMLNVLYLRQTLVSAHISIIPEFWEKVELLGYSGDLFKGKTEIANPRTESRIYFRGIQTNKGSNEANLKSIHNVGLVLVDEAQELVDEKTFDRLDLSLRDQKSRNRVILSLNPSDKTHWIYRRFFKERGIADDFNGIAGDTCYMHTTYLDNLAHLSPDFIRLAEEMRRDKPAKYRHIFLGFWEGNTEGALWTDARIDAGRVATAPPLDRIVVAIDPSVTGDEKSDEAGIVVVGVRYNAPGGGNEYYVLADRSTRGSPETWCKRAVTAYDEFRADRIVAEVNNGGDLVESVLRAVAVNRHIPYRSIHASRGKIVRAEPVAALYESNRVHHVGYFGELEDQMCNYTGRESEKSPDRMDALVWAITELSGGRGSGAILA